jgi:hypothetical protein
MKNKLYSCLLLLAAAFPLPAQDVRYNFASQTDFSKYKTYAWQKHENSVDLDDLTRDQLAAAFNAELAKKGLTATNADDADLIVVYQVAVREEKRITTYRNDWGYGPGWGPRWYGYGMGVSTATTTTDTIPIGSLDLDIHDAATKQLVWRGVVSKALQSKASPKAQQKEFANAAKKLLRNYPPKK